MPFAWGHLRGQRFAGAGSPPDRLARSQVDALTCVGFKWLCGPYGTGFCWLRPELRDRLIPQKAYWLALQTAEDLGKEAVDAELQEGLGARAFDVFGTANFFNFKPWAAAIEHLLETGLERIAAHDDALVSRFVDSLDAGSYELLSPRRAGSRRSTLVFFSHRDRTRNREIHASLSAGGIDVALRGGALRLSPHLYNGPEDIDRTVAVLRSRA
jgi:cysteine desulfurase / selenocysteine lyase